MASLAPAETSASYRVLASLNFASEKLDLDPKEVVLVGSAALALYGVTLYRDPYSYERNDRPHDVDMASTVAEMQRQATNGNFAKLQDNQPEGRQIVIRSFESRPLPVELISRIEQNRGPIGPDEYDHRFRQHWKKQSIPIEDSDFRIATPGKIASELRDHKRYDRKSQVDYGHFIHRSK